MNLHTIGTDNLIAALNARNDKYGWFTDRWQYRDGRYVIGSWSYCPHLAVLIAAEANIDSQCPERLCVGSQRTEP